MTNPNDSTRADSDIEKQHPLVADSRGDELGGEPLTVRLGDLWSDFIRVADAARDPDARRESKSSVPLLDDMKGILQWD